MQEKNPVLAWRASGVGSQELFPPFIGTLGKDFSLASSVELRLFPVAAERYNEPIYSA